jgi:hypothetical protein
MREMSVLSIKGFPEDIHRAAKAAAAARGEDLQDLIERAVKLELERLAREEAEGAA